MKKIFTMMAGLAMCLAASAQVAIWTTRVYSHWNEETRKYEEKMDTSSGVEQLFRYDLVDSFRVAKDRENREQLALYYYYSNYKGSYGYSPFYRTYHYESEQEGIYDFFYTLDSLVWQPYAVKGIGGVDSIVIPLRDVERRTVPNGEYKLEFSNFFPNPHYAYVTDYEIEVEDTTICNAKDAHYYYTGESLGLGAYNFGLVYNFYPYAEGKTKLKVKMNGVEKQVPVTITPMEGIKDPDYGQDSLFTNIFNRMIQSGNCRPAGCSDLPDVYDEGHASFIRALSYMNDISSDQIYWVWNDMGVGDLRHNNFKPDNVVMNTMFQRLYYNIYLCNSFLSHATPDDAVRAAEVRFVRAYLYYQLMDLFANVPIVTNNADFFTAPQATRAQLYDFVEAELLAAEQGMLATKSDYYRLDKVAAWLLLSRLYLNSEVYAGKQEFSKSAEYAYKVLQSSYSLCPNYPYLFMGDNNTNGAQNEIIWALREEGTMHSCYGGSLYLVAAFADGRTNVGINNSWTCINTLAKLTALFKNATDEDRYMFMTSDAWSVNPTGRTILKWTGLYSNGQAGTDTSWPDTDIPLFRMAEAYLNYAEAVLRGGSVQGGLTALQAVNTVRQRAHAASFESVTLDNILDERGREFYTEGMRRPDLVRFNKYGGETGYTWKYKGGSESGVNFPAHMNIYPIPTEMLKRNPNLVQNEGYGANE
jgi:hypothetical protein